jgi:hypothetical protein
LGISFHPSSATNVIPVKATRPPTGAKSNIAKGSPRAFSLKEDIMMFGGVPTSVAMPPKIVAKLSGMRDSPAARFAFCSVCISTGSKIAKAATLFMKAENMPPMNPIKAICADRDLDAFTKLLVINYTAPERMRPDETTSTKATVIVAGCPKPEKEVPVCTTPTITPIIRAEKATMSYRNRPHNRHKKTAPKRRKRIICCLVMLGQFIYYVGLFRM